jgi:hypothetical protein
VHSVQIRNGACFDQTRIPVDQIGGVARVGQEQGRSQNVALSLGGPALEIVSQ